MGCRHGGKWYEDYKMIGGQHRYAVDQLGGGRTDSRATAAARCWWAANIAAAGLPMMFMGTEMAQSGWWDTDQWHGIQWANAEVGTAGWDGGWDGGDGLGWSVPVHC